MASKTGTKKTTKLKVQDTIDSIFKVTQGGLIDGATEFDEVETAILEYLRDNDVSVNFVAEFAGLSDRAIQDKVKEGIIKKRARGKYRLLDAIPMICEDYRKRIMGQGVGAFNEIKLQRESEQLRKIRLANDKEEEILVNAKEVEKELSKYLINVRNLRHLPRTYSQRLVDISLKFINDILKKKKIKKVTIPLKDKKKFRIEIENALLTDIDKNLELLSRGLDGSSITGS